MEANFSPEKTLSAKKSPGQFPGFLDEKDTDYAKKYCFIACFLFFSAFFRFAEL